MSDRLDEIEARAKAATAGKWIPARGSEVAESAGEGYVISNWQATDVCIYASGHGNGKFIASARTDIPYLLKRLRAAEAMIEAMAIDSDDVGHDLFRRWRDAVEGK